VYRRQLPRIYELVDLLPVPMPPDAYFQNFEASLGQIPQKLKQFRDLERELQGLDDSAWRFLKEEVTPLLTARDPRRGWGPLFDRLNQAKAFNYLKRAGCTDISFIPPAPGKGQKTPDLRAFEESIPVLCEVKTINVSAIEAERRAAGGAGMTVAELDQGFFRKLASDLARAKSQMDAYERLVHLPPASPELNPTENVWQFMRQAYLSNRVFRDYDDVVEISSSAWNKLIAEQGRIASIGTRSWTAISQGP
jgi:putative transposase